MGGLSKSKCWKGLHEHKDRQRMDVQPELKSAGADCRRWAKGYCDTTGANLVTYQDTKERLTHMAAHGRGSFTK